MARVDAWRGSRAGSAALPALLALLALPIVPAAAGADAQGAGVESDGSVERLTLVQAIEIALAENDRLRAADARVDAAEAGLDEARAGRLPRVELSESWMRTTNPTAAFSTLLNQERFGADDFAVERLNDPDAVSDFVARLAVTQPLWTAGRIRHGVAAAGSARDAAGAGRERTRQETIHETVDAFTAAVLADAQLAVAEEAARTADAHLKLVRDLREGGLVVESDVLQARVRRSEVEELRVRAEAAVAVSRAALNAVLGRDPGTPFEPDAGLEPFSAEATPTGGGIEEAIEEALRRRPDLDAARFAADAADRSVRAARAERRPQVVLSGELDNHGDRVLDADGTHWSVSAGARWTLFDGRATGARTRRADAERVAAESMRDRLARGVEVEVRRAWHDLRAARRTQELAAEAVALARESLRIVEDRYREGLTTVVELLDAQTSLTRARSRETAARRDIALARASLDLAVGRL